MRLIVLCIILASSICSASEYLMTYEMLEGRKLISIAWKLKAASRVDASQRGADLCLTYFLDREPDNMSQDKTDTIINTCVNPLVKEMPK